MCVKKGALHEPFTALQHCCSRRRAPSDDDDRDALHSPVRYPARDGERGGKPSDRLKTFRVNDVQPAYSQQGSFFDGTLPLAHVLPLPTVP
jgi:hypothetical protein